MGNNRHVSAHYKCGKSCDSFSANTCSNLGNVAQGNDRYSKLGIDTFFLSAVRYVLTY